MTVQKKIKTKQKFVDVINYFKELPFYNKKKKKPKVKGLKNIDFLSKLPFMKN